MTWLKCSDLYPEGCLGLTDAEYRTLHEALCWVMRRERGPRFPKHELKRFAESADAEDAMRGLVAKGHVRECGDEYEVLHHMEHQTTPDVIAKRREKNAERQRRKRRRDLGLSEDG